jgi:hypothetical protein
MRFECEVDLANPWFVLQIMKKNYVPDTQDLLRCRVRTTGILENEFIIDKNQFKM